mgnify:CR=1 FL=1
MTKEFAATTDPSPIVTPFNITVPVPIQTLSSMTTGSISCSFTGSFRILLCGSIGCPSLSAMKQPPAIKQSLPIFTDFPILIATL